MYPTETSNVLNSVLSFFALYMQNKQRRKKENCMYNIFLYPFCKKGIFKYETTLLSSGFFWGRITPRVSINIWLLISDIQVFSPLFLLKIKTHFYDLSHTLSNTLINSYLISQPESRQTSLKIALKFPYFIIFKCH